MFPEISKAILIVFQFVQQCHYQTETRLKDSKGSVNKEHEPLFREEWSVKG